jgi:hypothetical protein
MKLFLFAGTIAVCLLCGSSFTPTSTVSVSGKIVWTDASRPANFTGMTVFVGGSEHPWSSNKVDSAQHYSVGFTHLGAKRYRFFITDNIDTLLLDNRELSFYDEAADADFTLPKTYKKRGGKAICPVCEKTDNVRAIVHDGVPVSFDKRGEPKTVAGGSIISPISPNWRCERDKVNY